MSKSFERDFGFQLLSLELPAGRQVELMLQVYPELVEGLHSSFGSLFTTDH
jgi:hypothetical protein